MTGSWLKDQRMSFHLSVLTEKAVEFFIREGNGLSMCIS